MTENISDAKTDPMPARIPRSHRWTKPDNKLSDAGIVSSGHKMPDIGVKGALPRAASRYASRTIVKKGV